MLYEIGKNYESFKQLNTPASRNWQAGTKPVIGLPNATPDGSNTTTETARKEATQDESNTKSSSNSYTLNPVSPKSDAREHARNTAINLTCENLRNPKIYGDTPTLSSPTHDRAMNSQNCLIPFYIVRMHAIKVLPAASIGGAS